MSQNRVTLPDIDQEVRTLRSYSDMHHVRVVVLLPKDEPQIREIFRYATRTQRRVTLHGGGHAFDDQSLGRDLVVSLERFTRRPSGPHPAPRDGRSGREMGKDCEQALGTRACDARRGDHCQRHRGRNARLRLLVPLFAVVR